MDANDYASRNCLYTNNLPYYRKPNLYHHYHHHHYQYTSSQALNHFVPYNSADPNPPSSHHHPTSSGHIPYTHRQQHQQQQQQQHSFHTSNLYAYNELAKASKYGLYTTHPLSFVKGFYFHSYSTI